MRISIIGPSASGKTTLAKIISSKYHLKHISLDHLLFTLLPNKKRVAVPRHKYLAQLEKITTKNSWIIEGINPIEKILNRADIIIWLKPSVTRCLYQQWKRFVIEKEQREKYGFFNNVNLSIYILKQHLGKPNPQNDPKQTWVKSVSKILKKYKQKTVVLKSSKEAEELITTWISKNKRSVAIPSKHQSTR